MAGHHQHQVRRGAKPGQPEGLAVLQTRQPQRAVADGAGAQQRRGLDVGEDSGDGVGERGRHGHQLGVTAVGIAAGGAKVRAEVLIAGEASRAQAAGRIDPGDAHPIAGPEAVDAAAGGHDPADHLMAQDDRQSRRWGAALDLVQLGVADAADRDLQQQFVVGWNGVGQIGKLQRCRIVLQPA